MMRGRAGWGDREEEEEEEEEGLDLAAWTSLGGGGGAAQRRSTEPDPGGGGGTPPPNPDGTGGGIPKQSSKANESIAHSLLITPRALPFALFLDIIASGIALLLITP